MIFKAISSSLLQLEARNFLRRRLRTLVSETQSSDRSLGVFTPGKLPCWNLRLHSCELYCLLLASGDLQQSPRVYENTGAALSYLDPKPSHQSVASGELFVDAVSFGAPGVAGRTAAVLRREAAERRVNGAVAGGLRLGKRGPQSDSSGPRTAPQAPPRRGPAAWPSSQPPRRLGPSKQSGAFCGLLATAQSRP